MERVNYLNGHTIYKSCLIYLFIFLFVIVLKIDSYPQAAAGNRPGNSAKLLQAEEDSSGFLNDYKVRAGLMAGISMPMGDLGKALGMGFGADIFADALLPYSLAENLLLRAGFNIGYYTFATKNEISASLTAIPFILNCKAVYPLSSGFSPYAGLGLGLTTNMSSGDVAKSSYDPTAAINFGTEYQHSSLPSVDFFLDLRYMMAFETVTGQFFTVLAGAAYKFGTDGAAEVETAVKEKPAEIKPAEVKPEYKKSEKENFPPQENFKLHQ
jgi:opacity protein-like surface antigen